MLLQLVLLARSVTNRLVTLETQLRSNIATAIPRLQQLATAGLPPHSSLPQSHSHPAHNQQQQQQGLVAAAGGQQQPAAAAGGVTAAAAAAAAELLPVRVAAFPAKLHPLERMRQQAASSRFMSLPAAHAAGGVEWVKGKAIVLLHLCVCGPVPCSHTCSTLIRGCVRPRQSIAAAAVGARLLSLLPPIHAICVPLLLRLLLLQVLL